MPSAFAPGKCILFGEHAVVFGHPAVAVAIEQGVRVSVKGSNEWRLEGQPFEPSMHAHLNPSTPNDPIRLAKMAHSAEATAQKGRASPTDTATSALGGCVVVSGEHVTGTRHVFDTSLETPEGSRNWAINVVDIPADIGEAWLVVGYSGTGSPTGRMVARVANLISESPQRMEEMESIANITRAGLTALSAGNMEGLGIAMDACHESLRKLEVSTSKLDRMVSAARPYSLGAKLTGAGGGGCMVALTQDPARVSEAIEIAGGKPLQTKLGSKGVSIL